MFDINIFLRNNIVTILVLIVFLLFSIISFSDISINEKLVFSWKKTPNIIFLIFAIILFLCFIYNYLSLNKLFSKERRQYKYEITLDENHQIVIKQGDISSYKGEKNKVVLLPANTSFDEKCITDANSALGSYFQKNYSSKIDITKKTIIDLATEKFSLSSEKKCANFGDTILLSEYDGEKVNILISAVTQDNPSIGIQANAIGVMSSIRNALMLCSENRFSSLTMPIIGTGQGGLKLNISLMLICIQYYLSVNHSQNHHVKQLEIIVFDKEKRLKNSIDEAVDCIKKLITKKGR